jgi:8-oxo-dGTP pyrophosphatase MutT (NUDIX family)
MQTPPVVRIDRLKLAFEPRPWDFATRRRTEIDRHFDKLRRDKPALWNGRVLLAHRCTVEATTLHAGYLETDFASFLAWRDWGFPDPNIYNCFALGALRASDGGFLLGVMAAHTANAGKSYFPGGTPDPGDIVGNAVDLEGSVRREVAEETGLATEALDFEPGWHAVLAGVRIALIKLMQAREPADALRARILDRIARQTNPELSDIRIAKAPADIDPSMPDFVVAFLLDAWCALAKPGTER